MLKAFSKSCLSTENSENTYVTKADYFTLIDLEEYLQKSQAASEIT